MCIYIHNIIGEYVNVIMFDERAPQSESSKHGFNVTAAIAAAAALTPTARARPKAEAMQSKS